MSNRLVCLALAAASNAFSAIAPRADFNPEAPRMVFKATLEDSPSATGAALTFRRESAATYFDIEANRLVTVPTNAPRFVKTDRTGKTWGAPSGLLLEWGAENRFLDSSFEGPLTNWVLAAGMEQRAGAGVHGAFGLKIGAPGALAHAPIATVMARSTMSYRFSIFLRRDDGADLDPEDAICGATLMDGTNTVELKVNRYAPVRLGDGPWHRVWASAQSERSSQLASACVISCRFTFKTGGFAADAAQFEIEPSTPSSSVPIGDPTTYMPTSNKAAGRAQESLSAPATDLFPGKAWTISGWHYSFPPAIQDHKIAQIRSPDGSRVFRLTRQTLGAGHVGVTQDRVARTGWLFTTVTYDGAKMDYFCNGVSDHSLRGPFESDVPQPLAGTLYWCLPSQAGDCGTIGLISGFTTWDRALTPEEVECLYRTGSPSLTESAKAPDGVPLDFKLGKAGKVSVGIYQPDGRLVSQLVVGERMEAGKHTTYWDGYDDDGRPAPAGRYIFKGIAGNVTSVWDGKAINTSPSPGNEDLQYRTGHYYDIAALTNGGLATVSAWGERGRVIQALDGGGDYPVRWSRNAFSVAFGVAAAVDGPYLYTIFSHWVDQPNRSRTGRETLSRWRLTDGAPVWYTESASPNATPYGAVWLTPPHAPCGWMSAWGDSTKPYENVGVCGLAARNGKLYIPYAFENRIAILDAENGRALRSFPCPAPRKLAFDTGGWLYVTSGKNVFRFDADGGGMTNVIGNLEDACGIAVHTNGCIYVTDLGASQQVKVFDPAGKPLKVFGQRGGHQGGYTYPDRLQAPLGIALAPDGALFVSDLGSQRVLAFNPDFSVRKEIHGMMSHQMAISGADPARVYAWWPRCDLWEYTTDYRTGQSRLTRRWYGDQSGLRGWRMFYRTLVFKEWEGRTFGIDPEYGEIFEIAGDELIPRVLLGQSWTAIPDQTIDDGAGWDLKKPPATTWVWRDANADGKMQASEYKFFSELKQLGLLPGFGSTYGSMDREGNLFCCHYTDAKNRGLIEIPFGGLDRHGIPIYTWETARWAVRLPEHDVVQGTDGKDYPFIPYSGWAGEDGHYYLGYWESHIEHPYASARLRKYDRQGNRVWEVGKKLGTVYRPSAAMCYPIVGFVDRYIFTLEYYGAMNVFDTDGLFVTRLFDDLAPEYQNTGECLGGAAFKHPNGNVYASIAPDCTYRISRIRVDGLDKTERFSGKLILAKPPSRPRNIEPEQRVWKILRRRDDVAIDGEINAREWNTDTDRQAPEYFLYNDARVATAWAQWDKDALYLACRIADATPALNRRTGADRLMSDQVEVVFRGPLGTNNPIMDCALAIGNDAAGKPSAFALAGAAKGQELPGSKAALVVQPGAGYALEARLPWAALSSYRPVPGDRLGWSVRIGWGAADGETLDHKCMWRFDYRPGSRNDIGAAMLGE